LERKREREREREREIPGISNTQAAVKLGGKICGSGPQRWRREREKRSNDSNSGLMYALLQWGFASLEVEK
jgi:hypothetical protein